MKRAALLFVLLLAGGLYGWRFMHAPAEGPRMFQGYVEGNFVYAAAEDAGRIDVLAADAGDEIRKGALLFALESSVQAAQRNEAEARLKQAQAQLANLKAAGQSPEQIAVIRAQEQQAQAQLALSRGEYERQQTLYERGVTPKAAYDQARAAFDRDTAALEVAQRQIDAAQLGGRNAEIAAAEAAVVAAEAALRQSETRLEKRRVTSVVDARVQDVFFRAGEVINPGQPVLALLPVGGLRIRFYAPETYLSQFRIGQRVMVACDRCAANLMATVSYISREAEYTPPVIFSQQERAKLVFRLEARPRDISTCRLACRSTFAFRMAARMSALHASPEVKAALADRLR